MHKHYTRHILQNTINILQTTNAFCSSYPLEALENKTKHYCPRITLQILMPILYAQTLYKTHITKYYKHITNY